MIKIETLDGIRELNLVDLIHEFEDEVTNFDRQDIDYIEYQLVQSQYSYIKFGLILDKIRNRNWWQACATKFADFRAFCQAKVNLNIWQVQNAIKSAKVAQNLAFLGFTEIPRNASQALKLAGLSIERLGEVWGNILTSCAGHKITAAAIEQAVNPDAQPSKSSIMLPVGLVEKLSREAVMRGISVAKYIDELMELEQAESDAVEPEVSPAIVAEEIADLLDRVEAMKIPAVKIVAAVGSGIDRMRQSMYDRYFPQWRREPSYG